MLMVTLLAFVFGGCASYDAVSLAGDVHALADIATFGILGQVVPPPIRAPTPSQQQQTQAQQQTQEQERQRRAEQERQEETRLAQERQRQAEARKAAKPKDLYGSIVFSRESEGGYAWGIAWNTDVRAGARSRAISACRGRGGDDCEERLSFRNGCGALFIGGTNGWGVGTGDSTAGAIDQARAACESSNTNCRLAISRCTSEPGASPAVMAEAGDYEPPRTASAQRVAEAEARRQAEARERQRQKEAQERERRKRVEQEKQKERNRLARERHRQAQERQRRAEQERQKEQNRLARERHRQAEQQVKSQQVERRGVRAADRARRRDQWGAIATGEFTTGMGGFLFTRKAWGVSHGWKTRDEAEAAAEKACYEMVNEFDSNSAAICIEKAVFNNECGAVFDGVAFEAGGTRATKELAVAEAKQNCDGRNIRGGCHLLASHCSPPQPDQRRRAGQNRQVGARGDLYGSIVFSQESGGDYAWGMAWNYGSRDTARQRAAAECQNRGGSSCGEIQWFRNACGALFRGDGNGWGTGWGATKTDAESMARAYCESHNRNCRLEVSRCVTRQPQEQQRQAQRRVREREQHKERQPKNPRQTGAQPSHGLHGVVASFRIKWEDGGSSWVTALAWRKTRELAEEATLQICKAREHRARKAPTATVAACKISATFRAPYVAMWQPGGAYSGEGLKVVWADDLRTMGTLLEREAPRQPLSRTGWHIGVNEIRTPNPRHDHPEIWQPWFYTGVAYSGRYPSECHEMLIQSIKSGSNESGSNEFWRCIKEHASPRPKELVPACWERLDYNDHYHPKLRFTGACNPG